MKKSNEMKNNGEILKKDNILDFELDKILYLIIYKIYKKR